MVLATLPISLVATPIVNLVIQEATALIKRKYGLLQGLEGDIEKLKSELTIIAAVLEDAENRQLDNPPLRDWLGKLNLAAYDANDILETLAAEAWLWEKKQQVKKFKVLPSSAAKAFHKLDDAHKIKEILKAINQIAEEKNKFILNASVVESGNTSHDNNRIRMTRPIVDESDVVGRDDDKNKIIPLLTSEESDREGDDISVIPIIGMGGLGKTTLAQLIYNDDGVKGHFEFRMWVCVTVNFNYTRILKEMIEKSSKMTYDINLLSEDQLESRFLEFLPGKRFLLVLDDVWVESYAEWEKLHKLLKLGGKGCKVLITGRNTRVSDIMGTQSPYLLGYLPEDQCWSLFERIVFRGRNLGSSVCGDLEIVGKKIVGKCQGLPLAVKAMAGVLLGNYDKKKWERILRHEIWKVEKESTNTGEPIVLPALKLSYDHLTSHLKQCFAYCYIFPKAYAFDKIQLVKLWKAHSFIQNREGETMDDIGCDYFDELVMRSFFQPLVVDDREIYRMHDLIHDLAQSVSSPHCYQVKENGPWDLSDRCRHVSLLCKDAEQPALQVIEKSKKLRTLLSPGEYQITFGQTLDKIFRTLKYIRVLDLSSSVMLELPKSVEELKLLRYLDLSKTEIRTLPNSICNLFYLQILKLLGCLWLSELPKDLGNLSNLQHLELDEMFWYKLSVLPPRLGRLISLKNLHAFHVDHKSGYRIDELKDMKCLEGMLHISKLENAENVGEAKLKDKEWLEKVVFEWSNRGGDLIDEAADESIIEELQPHPNLHELQIFHYGGTRFPSWIRDPLLQNLVSLSLNQCTKCKVLSLGKLPNLRKANIKRMAELEEWPDMEYPLLDTLRISSCPKMKRLPLLFPKLRVLKIKKCNSLRELPVIYSLQFLILIDNLILESWNEAILSMRFVDDQGQQVVARPRPSFINLLELKIICCPKLQALPKHFAPQKLEIRGCQLLGNLPIPEQSQRLQHLAVDTCYDGTLVSTIPNTSSLYSLVISNISSLTSLPKLPHLPGLKVLYISECKHLESLSSSSSSEEEEASFQGLTSIKLLSIRNCPKLVTFPSEGLPATLECLSIGSCPSLKSLGPSDILKSLTSLKDLYIEDCPSLQSLPEEGLSNSVQHLRVEGCPLLVKCFQEDRGPDWSMIKDIPDLEFESIEVVSVQTSPKKMEPVKPKASSSAWFHHITCKGIDTRDIGPPSSLSIMQREEGQTSKGKMVQGETSSTSAEPNAIPIAPKVPTPISSEDEESNDDDDDALLTAAQKKMMASASLTATTHTSDIGSEEDDDASLASTSLTVVASDEEEEEMRADETRCLDDPALGHSPTEVSHTATSTTPPHAAQDATAPGVEVIDPLPTPQAQDPVAGWVMPDFSCISSLEDFFQNLDLESLLQTDPIPSAEVYDETEFQRAKDLLASLAEQDLVALPDFVQIETAVEVLLQSQSLSNQQKGDLKELQTNLSGHLSTVALAIKAKEDFMQKISSRKQQAEILVTCKKKFADTTTMKDQLLQKRALLAAELNRLQEEIKTVQADITNADLGISMSEKAIKELGQKAMKHVQQLNQTKAEAASWELRLKKAEMEVSQAEKCWVDLRTKLEFLKP